MSLKVEFEQKTFPNKKQEISELKLIANLIRQDIIKSLVLAKSGHSGGPLGMSDIMSVLYFNDFMKYNHDNYEWGQRDRFVLSAGHMAPVLYATLARAGFFPCN